MSGFSSPFSNPSGLSSDSLFGAGSEDDALTDDALDADASDDPAGAKAHGARGAKPDKAGAQKRGRTSRYAAPAS